MPATARKKKQQVYTWKPAARRNKVARDHDAQTVGVYIEELRRSQGGYLSPEDVVNAAKSKKSPIHTCFIWNDRSAAHQHRLTQARWLLQNLTVTCVYANHQVVETEPQRVFVVVTDEEEGDVFTSINDAMSKAAERRQLVKRALRELKAWRRKYGILRELAKICEAIDSQLDD
ncbi:MAG: hypothetical protein GWN58_32805 [Anaerolineae bacterium]|nr:hypothetical protein [Thermoplasmata archaeon]NIV34056.1 hypothetical protein [Anaerolineae bacterium]NIY05907.1 hypothetical protein [Thermoplasmata archaeon]